MIILGIGDTVKVNAKRAKEILESIGISHDVNIDGRKKYKVFDIYYYKGIRMATIDLCLEIPVNALTITKKREHIN